MSSSAVWDVSSNWEEDAAAPWYDTDNEEGRGRVCSAEAQVSWDPQCKERLYLGVLGS